MTIRALLFDIGGVLFHSCGPNFYRTWEMVLQLQPGELERVLFKSQVAHSADTGNASPTDVWDEAAHRLGMDMRHLTMLQADIWDGVWDEPLLAYAKSLRDIYQVGILSNGWLDTRDAVVDQINYETFDLIMISAEEGVRKPNSALFKRALQSLDCAPNEVLMIDNDLTNVQAARAVGMSAIQYESSEQIIAAIQSHLRELA